MAANTNDFLKYYIEDLINLAADTTKVRKLDGEEMQQLIEALGDRLSELRDTW